MLGDDYLFRSTDLFSVQEHQRQSLLQEIAAMDGNRLLNTNEDDLVTHLAEKYSLLPPVLLHDQMHADQAETQIDVSGDPMRGAFYSSRRGPHNVPGTRITVWLPFEGDAGMFKVRPNTFSSSAPRGRIESGVLVFEYEGTDLTPGRVKQEIDGWVRDVGQYLEWQNSGLGNFNQEIGGLARSAIGQRRNKLLADQSLVASLGIPLRKRADAPPTYKAPEVRRKLLPAMPSATSAPFKPEPALELAEYEHVLSIMESMVKVMERSPRAFHDLDEEAIRSHFLVQLNGHYQGDAAGETFNYEGKTDILIRSGNRNIFIAECKVWGGPAKLSETIDQLLRYLSWRDSKAAILLFNRNKDFSKVLASIPDVARAHSRFRKQINSGSGSHFRALFRHKDDGAKDIMITILAFDIPQRDVSA